MKYENIDFLFSRVGSEYSIRITNSPGGQADYQFKRPFSDTELENFLLKIGRQRRSVNSSNMDELKSFGAKLFENVFCQDVRVCFERSIDITEYSGKGLRIRLHLMSAPELAYLPWEYIYKSSLNRFLSLSVETPIIRYLDLPERVPALHVKPPLKILVMISNPVDLPALNTQSELNKLTTALKDLMARNLFTVDYMENSTIQALHQRLRNEKYHIFHYIGHGMFDHKSRDGMLAFEDELNQSSLISGEQLGLILKDHNSMKLVVLNACEGARASIEDPFSGTAQSLVQQGIPAVIAMQFKISDEAAITLSQDFYSFVAQGYPVDEALAETRKAICVHGNLVEWGVPVLYMRSPDGYLFDLPKANMKPKTSVVTKGEEYQRKSRLEVTPGSVFNASKIKKFWLPLGAIVLLTALIIGMLSSIKVSSTQIELNLEVSEFLFRIRDDWDMSSLAAEAIAISNLSDLSMEIVTAEQATDFDPETDKPIEWQRIEVGEQLHVHGSTADWGVAIESNYLSLTNTFIKAGALVHISRNDNQHNQININVREGSVVGNINTGDNLLLNCHHCEIMNSVKGDDQAGKYYRLSMFDNQIQFQDKEQAIRIQMETLSEDPMNTATVLGEFIPIKTISFTKLSGEKIEPTIVSGGTVSFADLNNEKLEIHDGDFVFLNDLKEFQIKKMKLTENLNILIHGKVGAIEIGTGSLLHSPMPTCLEWLYANQSIALFLATLIPVLSIFFVVLRQLKIINED